MTHASLPPALVAETGRRVRVGAGLKLAPAAPASVRDAGRVRVGAGLRSAPSAAAATADAGRVRVGAGLRVAAAR